MPENEMVEPSSEDISGSPIPKGEYPSNSVLSRRNYRESARRERPESSEREKRVDKVVTGEVIQRKRPLSRRILETFAGEDANTLGTFILFDVLVPAVKNMLSDAVSQGVERMFFGDSRPRHSSHRSQYTSYNRMYPSRANTAWRNDESRQMTSRARATHDFGQVILDSRGEAEDVVDRLSALIEQYDVATVADLYELVGITSQFTDDKWGWTDLRGSSVRRVRDGYLLELPRTVPLD